MLQKFAGPLVGASFRGGPCLAEHAEHSKIRLCSRNVILSLFTKIFCCLFESETICKLGVANDGVVYATCEYTAKNADELSFVKGKPLKVSRKGDGTESEWWWATVDGRHGYMPQNLLSVSLALPPTTTFPSFLVVYCPPSLK